MPAVDNTAFSPLLFIAHAYFGFVLTKIVSPLLSVTEGLGPIPLSDVIVVSIENRYVS